MPDAELERAKAAAVSSVLMNLESRAVVAEDIGRQVLTYGHRCAARTADASPPTLVAAVNLLARCTPVGCGLALVCFGSLVLLACRGC